MLARFLLLYFVAFDCISLAPYSTQGCTHVVTIVRSRIERLVDWVLRDQKRPKLASLLIW